MKKIIILLIFLLLTGCSYIELNDLSIIKSIGIDYQNNEYILYAEIIDNIDKENIPTTKIISAKDQKIDNCFKKLIVLSNKTIHYSHIDLLILSDNLNQNNLEEFFKFILNNKNFRNDFMTISSSKIEELLTKSEFDEIEELIKNNQHKDLINVDIETVIKEYLDYNSFTLSLLTFENNNVTYKYNVKYTNNKVERINNEEKES